MLVSSHRSGVAVLSFLAAAGASGLAAEPVAHWDFGTEETSKLKSVGGVHRDQPGPRPPEFPDFGAGNTAVKFQGDGARYVLDDPGQGSPFDFTNGDSITIEAWVDIAELGSGENRYIIGKGRTHREGFTATNQNWALRVREIEGMAHVSFLFATPGGGERVWHRFNSSDGFHPGTGWHHVAVSYTFGKPDSAVAWIDGMAFGGSWDMGGATAEAPVVDDDQVWIASAMGGSARSSFRGMLDEIAVHRRIVPDEEMAARFRRVGPERVVKGSNDPPELGELPEGEVLLIVEEGLGSHTKWPDSVAPDPREVVRTTMPAFYLHRLPYRYDGWGIRDSWEAPVRVTMAADLELPPGRHAVLTRTRGLSRLWVDGERVLQTKPHSGSSDGHGPVLDLPEPPAPGMSMVAYGDHEYAGELEVPPAGRVRVVLETIVGGKRLRADPGEMLVAVGARFELLAPSSGRLPITPSNIAATRVVTERHLAALDTSSRDAAAASMDMFWQGRHQIARDYAATQVFKHGSVDGFLDAKLARARAAAKGENTAGAEAFHRDVLPVLREQCFRCHGEKEKGDLRLDSREAALAALVPGDPSASELLHRITTDDGDERMPPAGDPLEPGQVAALERWIQDGAHWPAAPLSSSAREGSPDAGDAAFLRRAYLDTVGVPPTVSEAHGFFADPNPEKRAALVDRLLDDPRLADGWLPVWQDVLAENPNMLKPSLNNSGPFRWFLHEALRDHKPLDRMVTELLMMRGSEREGGSAGFGYAADNDSPLASKAHIVGGTFLGIEMQCARCHDSPYHSTTQRDLYSLAAMLNRKPLAVPESSTVPASFFEGASGDSLVKVTLPPGVPVEPEWTFLEETGVRDGEEIAALATDADDPRARLAALVTAPANGRFAKVAANRVWRRLMGAGLVEPAHDWEGKEASHPELLDWLGNKLLASGYDTRHLMRLIMTSEAYARAPVGSENRAAEPASRFFAGPDRRRMSAEQVVDSLYAASGRAMDVEELTFDPDGRRPANVMISLGHPSRAWEFTSLSNERDRPSLALPRAQAVSDVLRAFGWQPSRPAPVHDRDTAPDVLQPGVLANSTLSTWVTRASEASELADLAVGAGSLDGLVDSLFLRFLGRLPASAERQGMAAALAEGFDGRVVPEGERVVTEPRAPLKRVSWTNHLHKDANRLKLVAERRARAGDPADPRLRPGWRERYEDVVWSLINTPEFVWIP